MIWKEVNLHGSVGISRLSQEYVIDDLRVPSTHYRVKVFESRETFIAFPNIRFREADGTVDGICGIGPTEFDALQDVIERIDGILTSRPNWEDEDLDWSDPADF